MTTPSEPEPAVGPSIGDRLRRMRLERGLTIARAASEAGLSRNYLAQIESGTANPSVGALKKVSETLGVPLGALFEMNDTEPRPADGAAGDGRLGGNQHGAPGVEVVRAGRRKRLVWPDRHGTTFLLTPDMQRRLEVTMDVDEPGQPAGMEPYQHDGEEFGIVLEGTYEVVVGDERVILEAGDSIYYQSHVPHAMQLIGDRPGRTIWVITPPSF